MPSLQSLVQCVVYMISLDIELIIHLAISESWAVSAWCICQPISKELSSIGRGGWSVSSKFTLFFRTCAFATRRASFQVTQPYSIYSSFSITLNSNASLPRGYAAALMGCFSRQGLARFSLHDLVFLPGWISWLSIYHETIYTSRAHFPRQGWWLAGYITLSRKEL